MAIKFVDEADLTVVGNAIRAKTGGTGLLAFPAGMAEAVSGIQTAKPEQAKSATPSLSAQTITPDSGKALSSVSVSAITKELLAQLDGDFVASNILQGVDLFGLAGTATAGSGGSGAKIVTGKFTPAELLTEYEVTHNLGVIPNFAAWWHTGNDGSYDGFRIGIDAKSSYHLSAQKLGATRSINYSYDNNPTGLSSSYAGRTYVATNANINTVKIGMRVSNTFAAGFEYAYVVAYIPEIENWGP